MFSFLYSCPTWSSIVRYNYHFKNIKFKFNVYIIISSRLKDHRQYPYLRFNIEISENNLEDFLDSDHLTVKPRPIPIFQASTKSVVVVSSLRVSDFSKESNL